MDLFSSIPVLIDGITGGYILTQIQMRARDLFTGIFHVSGSQQITLFFLEGRLISIYRPDGRSWEALPQAEWDEVIAQASGDLRELVLPDEGLRVCRLLLEADFGESRTMPSVRASEMPLYVSKWQRGDRAGLVLLRQADSSAVMLLPAHSPEPTEGMLISQSQLRTGPAVVTQVRSWGDRPCQITLCTQNERSEGWLEYNLRLSFGGLIQRTLKRYEELAGRFLVSDLAEQVNMVSHSRGWAISLFGNSLSIRQYFETTEGAGRAYASLLHVMNRQMDSVVGKKMSEAIFSGAVLQLGDRARDLLQTHVFSRSSSEGTTTASVLL